MKEPICVKCGRYLPPELQAAQSCTCGAVLPENMSPEPEEVVDHPPHYGGADNPYEAIKVIEAWGLGFSLGNAVKYICRAGKKGTTLEDLKKARWYLDRQIEVEEKK